MHAILVWFDHLPYGVPGCCGNTEASTPGFDHFAAGSVVFDNCFVNDCRGDSAAGLVEALQTLSAGGVAVRVWSVHPTHLLGLVNQRAPADAGPGLDVERLEDEDQLRHRLAGAAESASAEGAASRAVTVISLPGVVTPGGDVLAEVLESADRLLDQLAVTATSPGSLLLVCAGGGHVSAEPGQQLHERLIHVPLLGRSGPPLDFGLHSPSLVALSDVPALLRQWGGLTVEADRAPHAAALLRELSGERVESRQSLLLRGPQEEVGVRTREWFLRTRWPAKPGPHAPAEAAERAMLFVKPDDLWDSLDVASQSPAVVEELVGMLPMGVGKSGGGP